MEFILEHLVLFLYLFKVEVCLLYFENYLLLLLLLLFVLLWIILVLYILKKGFFLCYFFSDLLFL